MIEVKKNLAIAILAIYSIAIVAMYVHYDKRAFLASDEIKQLVESGRCN